MDKKLFFESLLSETTSKGDVLDSFSLIKRLFEAILAETADPSVNARLAPLFHEILLRARMFDGICNGDWERRKEDRTEDQEPFWPLIVVYLFGEPLFVNRSYCRASGLSPEEIRMHARSNDLYECVYIPDDVDRAKTWVEKLRAGRGYHDFWLSMKHSHRLILWNSYGWVWEQVEIRVGRDITNLQDVKNEGAEHYSGDMMHSSGILEDAFSILAEQEGGSPDVGYPLAWLAEFLSMFDFLWNHGGFLMECVLLPKEATGDSDSTSGTYNSVYAQFLETSFHREENFKKRFSLAHGQVDTKTFLGEIIRNDAFLKEEVFYRKPNKPVAKVFWRFFSFSDDFFTQKPIFGIGMPVKLFKEEPFLKRIFTRIRKKESKE